MIMLLYIDKYKLLFWIFLISNCILLFPKETHIFILPSHFVQEKDLYVNIFGIWSAYQEVGMLNIGS